MAYKVGVIGTGAIGVEHARRINQRVGGASVVAVTDIDGARAKDIAAGIGARALPTGREVIAAPDVDVVVVTSWGATHEEFVLAAIAAGKPVFCGKPLATAAAGCIRIDVEVFVNCEYGYDIQCEVVGESGVARLPEPASVMLRSEARRSVGILVDWKQRFIDAYDVELQAFFDDLRRGGPTGPSSWDGYAAAVTADACLQSQQSGEVVPVSTRPRPAFYGSPR